MNKNVLPLLIRVDRVGNNFLSFYLKAHCATSTSAAQQPSSRVAAIFVPASWSCLCFWVSMCLCLCFCLILLAFRLGLAGVCLTQITHTQRVTIWHVLSCIVRGRSRLHSSLTSAGRRAITWLWASTIPPPTQIPKHNYIQPKCTGGKILLEC